MDDGDGGGITVRTSIHLGPLSLPAKPPPQGSATSTPASAAVPTPRRQMVALKSPTKQPQARCAEMAGARTAECTAICCCLPCTVLDFMVLTCIKLPAGLCKKAARKRKEKLRKEKMVTMKKKDVLLTEATTATKTVGNEEEWPAVNMGQSAEEKQMEKEMWAKFYSTGFWRSASQQEP